ncbi:MAG: elongation factor Ts [Chloroflexi bacterium]|nr:elongation factor Ts [Chloroflexota bacterium]
MVKELREKSGAGVMECRNALVEANGDIARAETVLKEKGLAKAEKKASRITTQGIVECYIHAGGRIGTMVELNTETDFVARTGEFKTLAHELAMQVAALAPKYIGDGDIPPGTEVNPQEDCLLQQPYIKDPSKTIQDVIKETIAKVGENIRVRRFVRFVLGG